MRRTAAAAVAAATLLALGTAGCAGARDDARDDGARDRGDATTAPPAATATAPPPAGAATTAPAGAADSVPGRAPSRAFEVEALTLRLNRGGDRPLPVRVWYPDADRGRFPVVLFSHGLGGEPQDYRLLLTRWAAAGFVVVAPAYPGTSGDADRIKVLDVLNQPADASYVLTEVLALDGRRGPLRGRLATSRVGAAGHSAGGVTTIGLFTGGRDERLDAGVVLAGNALGVGTGFAGAAAPMLFVHGQRDGVVSYASGKLAYDAVPWPKAMLTLPDADHAGGFLADGARGFRVVTDATTDFLRWSLYGDAAAKRRLTDPAAGGGVATLDDRL